MEYDHTQRGMLHHLLYVVGAVILVMAWWLRAGPPELPWIILLSGLACMAVGPLFHHLTVRDRLDRLEVRFGPAPLFGTTIPYDQITDVRPDRSTFWDGWGVHWLPGRGVIYNVHGFDCVRIKHGRRITRVGTDDVENLVQFLRRRIGQS